MIKICVHQYHFPKAAVLDDGIRIFLLFYLILSYLFIIIFYVCVHFSIVVFFSINGFLKSVYAGLWIGLAKLMY